MYKESHLTKTKALSLLKKYRGLLTKNGIDIERMYLFGSFARGDFNAWSDIDVVIIGENMDQEDTMWDIREQVDLRITPLAYSNKQWEEEISIKPEVEKNGIRIM